MKNKYFGTPKLKFLYSLLLFQVVLYTIFRIGFLIYFKDNITPGTTLLVVQNFWLGFRFDVRLAMALLLPAMILINLPLNPAFKVRLMNILYTIFFGLISFLYVTDIGYFAYLKSRLNATVIQFLKNPIISFEMVRESYPWPALLALIVVMTVVLSFIVIKFITPKLMGSPLNSNNKTRFLGAFIFLVLFGWGLYGSVQMYPLRWSEAFATPDTFTCLLYTSPSPRDLSTSRMPSSA